MAGVLESTYGAFWRRIGHVWAYFEGIAGLHG